MDPLLGAYLFLLGLACGIAGLALTAYRRVSPHWLKWCLVVSGLLVISRYITMALFATSLNPKAWWGLRWCWYGSSVGIAFPSIVVLDQLVRHPAMSPMKLLRFCSPALAAYVVILSFGSYTLVPDRIVGMSPKLIGWGHWGLIGLQGLVISGLLWIGWQLLRKLRAREIRLPIAALMIAWGYLALDGLLTGLGLWYFRPFFFSEILALAAIWFGFETACRSLP